MQKLPSSVMQKMILFFDGDIKRINHALKVYGFAKSIGELEGLSDEEQLILDVSAILHDIGIKPSEEKYNSSAGNYQELEGPPVARELLKEFDLPCTVIDRICFLIGHHHSYSKIDGTDFQILVEADFLVNIFEDNMDMSMLSSINDKYFRTNAGKLYLKSIYK